MDKAFDQKKSDILQAIGVTSEDNPDASPKGTLDTLLVPLIDRINEHPDMVTTSSCSGRVSVFLEGTKVSVTTGQEKIGGKGAGGKWLYITHDCNDLNIDWWQGVKNHVEEDDGTDFKRYLLFKFEPMILHVKCRNQETANSLYSHAMASGFRETGIGSNCLVGIRISIRLDVPLGYLSRQDGKYVFRPIVTDDYVKEITQLSLELFSKNTKRINDLHAQINQMFITKPKEETKDERRERKRREGLARQLQLKSEQHAEPEPHS